MRAWRLNLRLRLSVGYYNSVFRRTMIFAGFSAPAYLAAFLTQYAAAAMLDTESFGLFYVAITLSNVLFSGSFVVNTHFTRYLVTLPHVAGNTATYSAMRHIERAVLRWGLGGAVGSSLGLLLAGHALGVQSPAIICLVIADVYFSYIADLGRVLLQSRRQTLALGLYVLVWTTLRLLLCIAGIALFRATWSALLGIVVSDILIGGAFHIYLMKRGTETPISTPLPAARNLLPISLSFGIFSLVYNLDIALGYLVLSKSDLAIYSASSVFPKAILAATLPLMQMLFAIMSGEQGSRRQSRIVATKTGTLVFTVALGCCGLVWLTSGSICGGPWGLRMCQVPSLDVLLLAVPPLAVIRVLLMLQFARGRDWLGLWLCLPTGLFITFFAGSRTSNAGLADGFVAFSFLALLFFAASSLVAPMIGRQRASADRC